LINRVLPIGGNAASATPKLPSATSHTRKTLGEIPKNEMEELT